VVSVQPGTQPRVSLCMIVRDEEDQLPRCLASVAGVVDEMIVVDTGSVDATPQIAAAHGARVLHHPWDGSFSTARNVSLDAATGDWVLVLDADEAVSDGSGLRAVLAAAEPEVEGFVLPIVNFVGDRDREEAVTSPAVRLFRNRPEYRYSRALHEQILATIQTTRPGAQVRWLNLPLEHWGYLTGVVADRDKVQRNLALAEEEVRRYPEDAFSWYNLGQEHLRMARWEEALAAYQRGFPYLADLTAGFAPALIKHLVVCLLQLKRPAEVLAVLTDALEAYERFTDLWVLRGHALTQLDRWAEAADCYRHALDLGEVQSSVFMSDEGVGSYKALGWLAMCERQLGRRDQAEEHIVAALASACDQRRYVPQPLDMLFTLYREQGRPLDEALAAVESRLGLDDPRWRELTATRLLQYGELALAERVLAALAEPSPETSLALATALLGQGRAREALAQTARVPDSSPARLTADWTDLLAHALAGEPERSAEILRARVAERGEPELVALYAPLVSLWLGETPQPGLLEPRDRLRGHLSPVLNTMLAAGALELFAASLPALVWLGYAPYEQAALVGEMYQHAGLTNLALEALMLAIESGDERLETWQLLGLLLLKQGAWAEAETVLARAVALEEAAGQTASRTPARQGLQAARAALARQSGVSTSWQASTT